MYKYLLIFYILFFLFSCTPININEKNKDDSVDIKKNINIDKTIRSINNLIGSGDIIKVKVYGFKELTGMYQVTPEGKLMFPFIGDIIVNDLTSYQVAKIISDKLSNGYLANPQVTVLIKELQSKKIFVIGEVKKSDKYQMAEKMNIVEAITLAGGFSPNANKKDVVVTRLMKGVEKKYVINPLQLLNILPDF